MIFAIRLKTIIITAILTVFFGAAALYVNTKIVTVSGNNWGLSFGQDNTPPTANETVENLKKNNAYYIGDTSEKVLYLTFDAGYENGYTPQILETLKKHNVKATFFVVGNYINTAPDIVNQMCKDGHIVGNHTFNHPDMSAISDEKSFKKELQALEKLYKETTGEEMKKFYRPPQGKYSPENLKIANKLGYKTIFWSMAYVDWNNDSQPDPSSSIEKLTKRVHPGAVVLLHNTSATNAQILDELLTKWKDMGYIFKSIEEL